MDPLDGSSLIGTNLTVGTIVGIYPGDVLEKGSRMIASLYYLYGPLTTLTLTTGNGVHEFVMNKAGQFVLSIMNLRIPEGNIYSPGALRNKYMPAHTKWIQYLEKEGYKLRYSGCFASDVHQILHKGGIFSYPGYQGNEKGKLRILFEANPMGKIMVEAGGAISDGKSNILNIKPTSFTQTTPVYIGGKKEVALVKHLEKDSQVE
jgi:fructose-1,6-bisphosphatase I